MESLFALPYGPFVIFCMRVGDVSLGTIRLLLLVRGRRAFAALVGTVEVLIWIFAVGKALQHLASPFHVIGYAAGFGAGTFVGMALEDVLALGTVVVRAIIPDEADGSTARALRDQGYPVTQVDGRGREGAVEILNTVVERKDASDVIEAIEAHVPRSFITVEELRSTYRGTIRKNRRHLVGK